MDPVPVIGEGPPVHDAMASLEDVIMDSSTSTAQKVSKKAKTNGPMPTRTLRARPSDPAPLAVASSSTKSTSPMAARVSKSPDASLRRGTDKEIDNIKRRLGPEGISEKKEEMIKALEGEIRGLMEEHDMAVREQFHLERYVTIVTGYVPEEIKQDNSPVFQEWRRTHHHDLTELLPPNHMPSAQAGPSRPRASLPSRQTRRAAHEQSELLSSVTGLARSEPVKDTNVAGKGKEKVKEEAVEVEAGETARKGRKSTMPPPPASTKAGRRKTLGAPVDVDDDLDDEDFVEEPKGKKRGRQSLPNLPASKKGKLKALQNEEGSASPLPSPSMEPATSHEPTPPPPPLPSLAHLPFPPPPPRPAHRFGKGKMRYTDPVQIPPRVDPPFDIAEFLESYIHIDDTGPPADAQSLHIRSLNEAYFRNRTNYLLSIGRLARLRDEQDSPDGPAVVTKKQPTWKDPPRKQDHRDHLMQHMVQVRNAMVGEAKNKPVVSRKIARMIMAHWERESGKEERELLAQERELKRRGKDLMRALRKRWGLAVKIIRAKVLEAQKAEQDRRGKEHLQNMLQRSQGLLDAQRDDMQGYGDDEDSDDGTDEVSAAEDSDEEEEEEEEEEEAEEGVEADLVEDADLSLGDGGGDDLLAMDERDIEENGDGDSQSEADGSNTDADDDGQSETPGIRDLLTDSAAPDSSTLRVPFAAEDTATPDPLSDTLVDEDHAAQAPKVYPHYPIIYPDVDSPDPINAWNSSHASLLEVGSPSTDPLARDNSPAPSSLPSRPSSARAMSRPSRPRVVQAVKLEGDDPDANDEEFEELDGVEAEDLELEQEMDDDESRSNSDDADEIHPDESTTHNEIGQHQDETSIPVEDETPIAPRRKRRRRRDDSEDEGLLADADLPIEELLKRYGYSMNGGAITAAKEEPIDAAATHGHVPGDLDGDISMNGTEPAPDQPLVNGHSEPSANPDKSLLDENLGGHSPPGLIVEGKRQRRARMVWSPSNEPLPKKPKVELVEEEEEDEEIEMTPDPTSSEEDEDGDEEVDTAAALVEDLGEGEHGPRLRPPFLLRGTLRQYQHDGLEWLASLYANNMNGILADEMGLGKTIQTIALLGHLACDKGVWGQHLIIVPTSVILNWEMEFKKFLPGMKVLTYYGNQKERKEKRIGWHTENAWQVCITSYQIVLADQHIFRRKNWVYMILDEAHNIKNFRSQRWQTLLGFKAARRLLLTGTPLQNNLMELWSLLYFLMPQGLAAEATAVVGFANDKDFMEWFSNPMDKAVESGDILDEETLATVAKLHTLLRPFILRRLKSEVETQLPGKFEHVVYCKLSKRQRFLYDEFMSRSSTKEALTSGGYLGVVNTLMQLRKVCNHPDLFEVRPVRTSFAMDKSVAADFEIKDLLVRRRLLSGGSGVPEAFANVTAREEASAWTWRAIGALDASDKLPHAIEARKGKPPPPPPADTRTVEGWLKYRAWADDQASIGRWRSLRTHNRLRCCGGPVYGSTLLRMLSDIPRRFLPTPAPRAKSDYTLDHSWPASDLILSYPDRAKTVAPLVDLFAVIPPTAVARDVPSYALPTLTPSSHPDLTDTEFDTLHRSTVKLQIAFPDASLLQYDCGKLSKLYEMLRSLKADGHRVLIFTQMTRVLDILEIFLSYNGHRYLRLDGSTKIEDRQIITERFNSDSRIFCFIASSRSGGVGINLTGADTVFFYDSDWNPSMDRQCMDRAHRIGQTREVHIYRFVSSHTVEENMLKKANQKRLLDRVVIQEGDFTTEFFGKMDWRDMLDDAPAVEKEGVEDVAVEDEPEAEDAVGLTGRHGGERELANVFAAVEDEEDVAAAKVAQGEGELDMAEFSEGPKKASEKKARFEAEASNTPVTPLGADEGDLEILDEEYDEDGEPGGVDEYMLKWVEEDWDYFVHF